jgi:hypothetical protein
MAWVSRYVAAVLMGIILLVGPDAVAAQTADLSSEADVSLITILPGPAVYEAFGHSAVRVHDPEQGIDRLYNYGTFRFDRWFVPKFLYGQLDYYLSVVSFPAALRHYEQLGRPVVEQRLNLTPEQRSALVGFLRTNAQPENRVYRYDFLFDNCSTRIRDACDAVWPTVDWSDAPDPAATFREMLDRYVSDRPWTTFGFYLALGPQVDRPVTPYEAMFLPDFLLDAADQATIDGPSGPQPLAAPPDTLLWIDGYTRAQSSFPWPAVLLWGLLAVGIAGTAQQHKSAADWMRTFDRVLFGVVGTAGAALAFLWFLSLHEVTNYNLNLLWAWPTHLAAVALLGRGNGAYLPLYWRATAAAALVMLAGWPFWPQVLYDGLIPLVVLLGLRAAWHGRVPGLRPEASA